MTTHEIHSSSSAKKVPMWLIVLGCIAIVAAIMYGINNKKGNETEAAEPASVTTVVTPPTGGLTDADVAKLVAALKAAQPQQQQPFYQQSAPPSQAAQVAKTAPVTAYGDRF